MGTTPALRATPPDSGGEFAHPVLQYGPDCFEHALKVFKDLSVLKSNNANFKSLHEPRSPIIPFYLERSCMPGPIQFDNDATFRTIKVGNVRTYPVLSSKFLSVQSGLLEVRPK